jgi:hypothetical protein
VDRLENSAEQANIYTQLTHAKLSSKHVNYWTTTELYLSKPIFTLIRIIERQRRY